MGLRAKEISFTTIIMTLVMVAVSVGITLLLFVPGLVQELLLVRGQIIKGIAAGISLLPVLLFITAKGGVDWYKKKWTWVVLGITLLAIVGLVVFQGQVEPIGGVESYMGHY